MLFANIAKNGINLVSRRFIRKKIIMKSWPNDWVPFHWSRPEKVPGYYSNEDLVDLGEPETEDLLPEAENSNQLRQLKPDDPVRKLFSIDHGKVSHYNKTMVHRQLKELGLYHVVNFSNSPEAKVVNLTFSLRHTLSQVQSASDDRWNGHVRQLANVLKHRRRRYLCELKELHSDRFERLKKTLDIEPDDNPINTQYLRPYRKLQMRKLAFEYAIDLKEKKVESYMRSLEEEKAKFEKEKEETLRWIHEQEKKLGTVHV